MATLSLNELVQAAARGDGEPLTCWDIEHPDYKMNRILEEFDSDYIPSPYRFPPVKVFQDIDGTLYLKDGYHRVAIYAYAAWKLGSNVDELPVEFVDDETRYD